MGDRITAADRVETFRTERGLELRVNGLTKDILDSTGTAHARYAAVMELPRHFFIQPGAACIIGIGSGALLRTYRAAGWRVSVAEPDSGMLANAEEGFGLNGSDTALHRVDGRSYLEGGAGPFGIVLIDAVSPGTLPGHLLTREFLRTARTRLTADGIVAIAVESAGWHDEFVEALGATMQEVFGNATVLPIAEPPNRFASIVVLGINGPRGIVQDPERNETFEPEWRYGPSYQITHAWDNHFAAGGRGMILTDATSRLLPLVAHLADSAKAQAADYLP